MEKLLCTAFRKSPNNRRLTSCINLLDVIMAKNNKILVCRIDLAAKGLVGHKLIAKLVRATKNKFKSDFYGYIYSCEYGKEVGKHYHVVFFLNGTKMMDAYSKMGDVSAIWLNISGMSSSIPRHNPKIGARKTTGLLRKKTTTSHNKDTTYHDVIYGLSYLCKNSHKIEGKRDFSMTQISRLKNRSRKKCTKRVVVKLKRCNKKTVTP